MRLSLSRYVLKLGRARTEIVAVEAFGKTDIM